MPTSPLLGFPYPDQSVTPWDAVFAQMVDAIDYALFAEREDRNIIVMGGGTMSFTASTGVLTWAGNIDLLAASTGYVWRLVGPGTTTLLDNQLMYLTVTRAPQAVIPVTVHLAYNVPNQPNGDDQLLLGIRRGSVVHFRDGFVLSDGAPGVVFDSAAGGTGGLGFTATQNGFGIPNNPHTTLNIVGGGVISDAGGGVATLTIATSAPSINIPALPSNPYTSLRFDPSDFAVTDAGSGLANIALVTGAGGLISITDIQSPYTVPSTIGDVIADASGGPIEVLLPAAPALQRTVLVADAAGLPGQITVNGNGALIDGQPVVTLDTLYETLTVRWTGSFWKAI